MPIESDPPSSPQSPPTARAATPVRATPVEYERPQGLVTLSRTLRLLLLVTIVNTMLLAVQVTGMRPWQYARQAWSDWSTRRQQAKATATRLAQLAAAEQQCRTYTFAPGHVVYTEVPAEAMGLIAGGSRYASVLDNDAPRGWQSPAIEKPLACLVQFEKLRVPRATMAPAASGMLFLHERQTAQGKPVLVGTLLVARHDVGIENVMDGSTGRTTRTYKLTKTRELHALVFAVPGDEKRLLHAYQLTLILPDTEPRSAKVEVPGRYGQGLGEPPAATQPGDLIPGNHVRFFGGQPDPADPSRWTIPYEIDGKAGVIDGWLKEDGILLRPRAGRQLPSPRNPQWELK